ncbi:MAG: hypothetical protein OXK80_06755 [Bdellovibrionales bacterium]|nr:hypothetical protein [Bdellovibrionales bacterium]
MNTYIDPLSNYLNQLSNKIRAIISSQNSIGNKKNLEKILSQLITVQSDLIDRKSFFENYYIFIYYKNDFCLKNQPLFEETISKYKSNIPPRTEQIFLKHHDIRLQLLIALLALQARVYERCTLLCYLLHNPKNTSQHSYASDIFIVESKNNPITRFIKKTNISYMPPVERLKNSFGYYLAIILFFRNRIIHTGNDLGKNNIQIFNDRQKNQLDHLNKNSIEIIHNEILTTYRIQKDTLTREHLDTLNNNESFDIILDQCRLNADHLFGQLILKIYDKIYSTLS